MVVRPAGALPVGNGGPRVLSRGRDFTRGYLRWPRWGRGWRHSGLGRPPRTIARLNRGRDGALRRPRRRAQRQTTAPAGREPRQATPVPGGDIAARCPTSSRFMARGTSFWPRASKTWLNLRDEPSSRLRRGGCSFSLREKVRMRGNAFRRTKSCRTGNRSWQSVLKR